MDRREAFLLLGLQEDAGRSQIEAAYSRRAKKYHSKDYDDEPEYARRKLQLLKVARDVALGGAPSSSEYVDKESRYSLKHIASDENDFSECTFDSEAKHSTRRHTGIRIDNRHDRKGFTSIKTRNISMNTNKKSIVTVLVFGIIFLSIVSTMCSAIDINYDDSYYQDEYYEDHITKIADELNDEYQYLFDENPNTDIVEESYLTDDIINAGNSFTYEYTDGNYYELDEWIIDLQWAYPDEFQSEYTDTESALHDIFNHYGFPEYAYFLGEVNYYTDEQILSFLDYVNFLIDYYY